MPSALSRAAFLSRNTVYGPWSPWHPISGLTYEDIDRIKILLSFLWPEIQLKFFPIRCWTTVVQELLITLKNMSTYILLSDGELSCVWKEVVRTNSPAVCVVIKQYNIWHEPNSYFYLYTLLLGSFSVFLKHYLSEVNI